VNVKVPTIKGTAQQGQTLTEEHGSWTNEPSSSGYTYQWLRCEASGKNCSPISKATNQTYLLEKEDVGHSLEVQEIATNEGGPSAPATSLVTPKVLPPVPVNVTLPTISGTPVQQGTELKEEHGKWSGAEPFTYTYQWLRCTSSGTGCTAISGATKQTYL